MCRVLSAAVFEISCC